MGKEISNDDPGVDGMRVEQVQARLPTAADFFSLVRPVTVGFAKLCINIDSTKNLTSCMCLECLSGFMIQQSV